MKRTIVVAVALAILVLASLATVALAQGPFGNYGPGGMMGGRGMMGGWRGVGAGQPYTSTLPYGPGGMMGGGMMGGFGVNSGQPYTGTLPCGQAAGVMGRGMMGGRSNTAPGASSLTIEQAITKMQDYVAALKNSDLKLVEVEEYSLNFYGVVREKSSGINAFQILVYKQNGAVAPEMGPNMMWNTKYSPMRGHMQGFWPQDSGKMTVTLDQARANATTYLQDNMPGTALEGGGDTYYGYYNMDVLKNGKTFGMLSVNGYTGAVWYHTWHGDFVQSKELE